MTTQTPLMNQTNLDEMGRMISSRFLQETSLADIQLKSYEHFINYHLSLILHDIKLVSEQGDQYAEAKIVNFSIEFQNINVDGKERRITPRECMERKMTYVFHLLIDLEETIYTIIDGDGQEKKMDITSVDTERRIRFAEIPIMVGSSLCILHKMRDSERESTNHCTRSSEGYFIINGLMRVLIAAERSKTNYPYTFLRKPNNNPEIEIRSSSEVMNRTVTTILKVRLSDGEMVIILPSIPNGIPVGFVLSALGVSINEFEKLCIVKHTYECRRMLAMVKRVMSNAPPVSQSKPDNATQPNPLYMEYVSDTIPVDKQESHFHTIMYTELLPHLGVSKIKKAFFIGIMINKLLNIIVDPTIAPDDRDNLENKRVDGSGELLAELIRGIVSKHVKVIHAFAAKQRSLTSATMKAGKISRGIEYSMSSGNWGSSHSPKKAGVSQLLATNISYLAAMSHLRRLSPPIVNTMNVLGPRYLGTSQYGFLCPVETPEGKQTGLMKNFALGSSLSIGCSRSVVVDFIFDKLHKYVMFFNDDMKNDTHFNYMSDGKKTGSIERFPLFVNGDLIGTFRMGDKDLIMKILREGRDNHNLMAEVSIAFKRVAREIVVLCDAGRVVRFVLNAKNKRLSIEHDPERDTLTFAQLVERRHIITIDSSEEQTLVGTTISDLRKSRDIDYCEISPSMTLGIVAATINFPDRNQAPRNTYQTVMAKQAMGTHSLNYNISIGTVAYNLSYPQKSLVSTDTHKALNLDQMSSFMNAIVAVMAYKGNNQEDALIFNKSSIERGMFQAGELQTYTSCSASRNSLSIEEITLPEPSIRKNSTYFGHLDKDGIVKRGSVVSTGDAIIGKELKTNTKNKDGTITSVRTDISTVLKDGGGGVVSKVYKNKNTDGTLVVKVTIAKLLIPEIGDKHASMNAQKGVISSIVPQEDLPFTSEGITPDIIMSPMAFPSRMTIAQLVTAVMGKHACMSGVIHDSTPFTSKDPLKVVKDLKDYG